MMIKKNYLILILLSCLLLSSIVIPVNALYTQDAGVNSLFYNAHELQAGDSAVDLTGQTWYPWSLFLKQEDFTGSTMCFAFTYDESIPSYLDGCRAKDGYYDNNPVTYNQALPTAGQVLHMYGGEGNYGTPFLMWSITGDTIGAATPRTITVTVKNLAGQALYNVPIEIYPNDLSDYSIGFTDVNGNYTDTLDIGANTSTHIHLVAYDIYESADWDFNFDSTPWTHQMIMFQASPSGTYHNITYHVQGSTGLSLAGVGVTHIVSPSFVLTYYTDYNGNVTFSNTPVVNNMANYDVSLTGYYASYGSFAFTGDMIKIVTLYPLGAPTPTVTPTPIQTSQPTITPTPIGTGVPFDTWTLEAAPNAISLGESSVLVAYNTNNVKTTAAGGLRTVFYYEKNIGAGMTQVGSYKYNSTTSDWDFRIGNTAPWQYSTSFDPMLCTITPTHGGSVQYFVTTFDINQVSMGTANCYIDVGGAGAQGSLNMVISANEATTTNHISNWNMDISNDLTGVHEIYTVDYTRTLTLSRGQAYTILATKEGYEDATKQFIVPLDPNVVEGDGGAVVTVPMFLIGSTSAGNTTVTVHINDAETYYPVGNVRIYVAGYGTKFTGSEGESASFSIPQNTGITIAASKDGYCAVSEFKNTSTLDYLYVPMFIKYGQCAGVTPIHTPIPNSTPFIVTPTPIGGYGNLSGNATVCNRTYVFNSDIAAYIKNTMACAGIADLLSQNLAFASLIILVFGLIGAKYAKGVGFALGAVIGATMSLALNLIPFWLIAVLVILMVLVAVLLIGRNTGG